MSKLDEKQIEKTHKSAAGQEDKAFEEWISQRVLDETAEMINGLENDPDLDDFEPSEELFQKIVGVAKERGLLAEADETAEDETEEDVVKIELSDDEKEKIVADNIPIKKDIRSDEKEKVVEFTYRRRMVVKWVAMIAVTLLGVFGVSMSSQANRTFVMQKVEKVLGDGKTTVIENNTDRLESDITEERDRNEVENKLQIKLPEFFYMPDEMIYKSYILEEDAQYACLEYSYGDETIFLTIFTNCKDASGVSKNDRGVKIGDLKSQFVDISVQLNEVMEKEDKKPTYIADWIYKNTYFEIMGKLDKEEMIKIIENILM